MSALYDRHASLVIGDASGAAVDVAMGSNERGQPSGLRVTFEVKKTSTSHPNVSTIKVYNLSDISRNKILRKKTAIILRAGYGDARPLPLLASGVVERVEHKPQQPDVETTIEIRDGGLGLDDTKVKRAYPAQTPLMTVVQDLLSEMPDVDKGAFASDALSRALPGKRCFTGSARIALDKLATAFGFEWSVQNGVAQFIDRTGARGTQITAVVLSAKTGMLGSPTKTNIGCNVESLLRPDILPGTFIQVVSAWASGYFKVLNADSTGDTHGDDFKTAIEAKAIGKWSGPGAKPKSK